MKYLLHSLLKTLAAATLLTPAVLLAQLPASPSQPGFAAGTAATASAPAASGPAAPGATALRPPADGDDHILVPGDLIEVKVFQEPDMDSTMRVAQDGVIVFPLIDRVKVGGLAPQAAAKVIQNLLNKDYLVNPQVQLMVLEYARRSFTVLGEVQKPGSFDMPDRSSVSLLEAIGMSGGYTRVANPSNVTVKRKVKNQEVIYRLNAKKMAAGGETASFEIQPDDVITVSESIF